jgi:hypothetical protein
MCSKWKAPGTNITFQTPTTVEAGVVVFITVSGGSVAINRIGGSSVPMYPGGQFTMADGTTATLWTWYGNLNAENTFTIVATPGTTDPANYPCSARAWFNPNVHLFAAFTQLSANPRSGFDEVDVSAPWLFGMLCVWH